MNTALGRFEFGKEADMTRYLTASVIGLALRHSSFRFSKDYRHGTTRFHRFVYACISTVAANYIADGDNPMRWIKGL